MRVLAIDPGNERSAYVTLVDGVPDLEWCGLVDNSELRELLLGGLAGDCNGVAIEMIASYGMPVGRTVFDTCVWVGRFMERVTSARGPRFAQLVYRQEVKLHLCGQPRAKDSNVRQALIDRFGGSKRAAVGLKADPGPLYGFRKDMWAALGVGITFIETRL